MAADWSRELMTLLQRQLLAPASGLFRATDKGELFPRIPT